MKSPGHQKWPNHTVREEPLTDRVRVEVDGELLAESNDVIKVVEDKHPTRYYFPRADVRMDKLESTETTTECPFKGKAHYFSLRAGGKELVDAVWTYEQPYEEHAGLQNRVAFYGPEMSEIQVQVGA